MIAGSRILWKNLEPELMVNLAITSVREKGVVCLTSSNTVVLFDLSKNHVTSMTLFPPGIALDEKLLGGIRVIGETEKAQLLASIQGYARMMAEIGRAHV